MYILVYVYIRNSQAELVQLGRPAPVFAGTIIYAPPPQDFKLFGFLLFLGSSQTPTVLCLPASARQWGQRWSRPPVASVHLLWPLHPPWPWEGAPSRGRALISIDPFLAVHCLSMVKEHLNRCSNLCPVSSSC